VPSRIYVILAAGWVLWFAPFVISKWNFQPPLKRDNRARWGMLTEFLSYLIVWQGLFWTTAPGPSQPSLSILLFTFAVLLSWTSVRALGPHLRLDAALGTDHELVRSGPYRIVRHPIYTSMLCVLLGTGLLISPGWLLLAALFVFIIGTEIRVRIEDGLLASRFGIEFQEYRRSVSAYVPFIR
jgi:protein-S-isoprenylcysteine O-methyltransferase Ste14